MKKVLVFVLVLYLGRLLSGTVVLAAATPAATTSVKIDYALPYPGMLENNPFFFLKVLRDKIVVRLIADPVAKSFYLLLLADKRISAGQMLMNRGEQKLGATTIGEAEVYFAQAVDTALGAKSSGRDTTSLLAKLTVAAAKHEEVIGDLMNKVRGNDSVVMQKAHQQSLASGNRVREVFLQNWLK